MPISVRCAQVGLSPRMYDVAQEDVDTGLKGNRASCVTGWTADESEGTVIGVNTLVPLKPVYFHLNEANRVIVAHSVK